MSCLLRTIIKGCSTKYIVKLSFSMIKKYIWYLPQCTFSFIWIDFRSDRKISIFFRQIAISFLFSTIYSVSICICFVLVGIKCYSSFLTKGFKNVIFKQSLYKLELCLWLIQIFCFLKHHILVWHFILKHPVSDTPILKLLEPTRYNMFYIYAFRVVLSSLATQCGVNLARLMQ